MERLRTLADGFFEWFDDWFDDDDDDELAEGDEGDEEEQTRQLTIGSDMVYNGDNHPGIVGDLVRVIAVLKGYMDDPDEADLIKTPGPIAVSNRDLVEFRPYNEQEGRLSWVSYDAEWDELEDL
jgi:hypothetical protein